MSPEQLSLIQYLDKLEIQETTKIEEAQKNIVRIEGERERILDDE